MKIQRLTADTLTARLLTWLARVVLRYRWYFVVPQLLLFVLCVLYTVVYLEFDTKRSSLVGPGQRYHENYMRFRADFPTQDDLVVLVESEEVEKNRQFVERLGARLEAETNLFHHVFFKGDLPMLGSKALLFVPEDNLVSLRQTLRDYKPFIDKFSRASNLVSIVDMINTQFRTAKPEQNAQTESLMNALPALERIVNQAADSLRRTGTPPSPGVTALFNRDPGADEKLYITAKNGRFYLVSVQARTTELNRKAITRLRELIAETQAEVPGLNVGLTGEPVLELDEMKQSQDDTLIATLVSLVVCAIIFIYGYQETGRPIKATFCLVIGLGYTMGFTTLAVGHLNILTITFAPILIGLAIDFGVHLISRYEEELRHGKSEETALTIAMVYTGQGIFTGALTTAGAFLAMAITSFKGIREMGIICGGGLLVCLVPMMTMLPALLLRGRQNVMDHTAPHPHHRAKLEELWLRHPGILIGGFLVLCGLCATQLNKVHFDYNLLHMQSRGLPAVETELRLINSANKSVLFAAIIATNLQQAAHLEQHITNLPTVATIDSMTQFLTSDQDRKLGLVRAIKEDLKGLHFATPDPRPVNITELSVSLYSLYGYLGLAQTFVPATNTFLITQLGSLHAAVLNLRKEMRPAELNPEIARRLASFQVALLRDLQETFDAIRNQDAREPLRVQDLPAALRERFIGAQGKYLIMVYPKKDVWQRQYQEEFIKELQTIDPDVTGTPVQLYYYTELLKTSYETAAKYALIAIAILVFIHFRSPLSLFLAMLPVLVGFLLLGGLMGWLKLPLNPANIMMLPLVIGIGVTNGIQVLNRYAEEQHPAIFSRSTGKAVLVSGLTSIAGFGSLILAKHQGIKSLGEIMSIGLATCMLAGLTFLPALLTLLFKGKRPGIDNARSTPGREEPR